MNIGLDLDNCVFDLDPLYQQAFYNTQYTYSIPSTYDVYKCYPKEIGDILKRIFSSKAIFYTEVLDPLGIVLLNRIYKQGHHDIYILSSRIGDTTPKTFMHTQWNGLIYETYQQLVRAGLKLPIFNINITHGNKLDTIKEKRIGLMIDDSPSVIESCIKNKIPCAMISTEKTKYNHYLRPQVEYFNKVSDIIIAKNLIKYYTK